VLDEGGDPVQQLLEGGSHGLQLSSIAHAAMMPDAMLAPQPASRGGRARSGTVLWVTTTEDVAQKSAHDGLSVLFDRVLVRPGDPEGERRSRAGILIPATAAVSRRLAWATAVAVGPHVRTVKVGDEVLYNPEDRFDVELRGEEFVILRERDIHAVAARDNGAGTGLYL
jgi:chaperonin GroES